MSSVKATFGKTGLLIGFIITLLAALGLWAYQLSEQTGSSGVLYLALINLNLILICVLFLFVGRRFVSMLIERKRGLVGARLHVRLLGIFSFLAVVPALFVMGFSVVFLNLGIESWFSNRVTGAIDGSLEVAQAYFQEHGNRLMLEARALARADGLSDPTLILNARALRDVLITERQKRNLAEVSVYTREGSLVAHAGDLPPARADELLHVFNQAEPDSRLFADYDDGRLVAATPMRGGLYLVLTRWVEQAVLDHLDSTRAAYQEYYDLRSERDKIRSIFTLFFVLMTIIILTGAIWAGLSLATRIVRPVTDLVAATNRVRRGDLSARVTSENDDEIGVLGQAFNQMTEKMHESHNLLATKNRELEERRRTIEAVFTGVTSGIISLDEKGSIMLANKNAREMFALRIGANISKYSTEIHDLFSEFQQTSKDILIRQIKFEKDNATRTLLVRMVAQGRDGEGAVVVTFDDITAMLSTQRLAAWADVAQRLAHEIKNPLTPIQLSAERLKRKYGKQIVEDKELFGNLTDTIVHQVGDMRQMLNEFSDFARMPAAKFARIDVVDVIDEALTLQKEARTDFNFELRAPEEKLFVSGDRNHLQRAITNIFENAINAISEESEKNDVGSIKVVVEKTQSGKITISVIDNGPGLPADVEVEKLFDPYITKRKNGTGLGLAIVKKVVDEHQGSVKLIRQKPRGTKVELTFPLYEE